ncbi:MAG: DMT family transporter [Prochloraceae cyanobacterium]
MSLADFLELLLLAAVWGASFLFMRIAAPEIGPVWLIETRVLLAGLALLLVSARLNLLNQIRSKFIPLFVVGCINSAIPFLLFAFASLYLSAGFNGILNATAPLFGTIIAFFWLKEKFTLNRIVGFAIGFAGVIVLVGLANQPTDRSFILAASGGLLAALMYAIASIYIKQNLSEVTPLVIATGSQLSAAILTVTYLIPLFAAVWGALVLAEPITRSMALGCGLILLGTAIAAEIFSPSK